MGIFKIAQLRFCLELDKHFGIWIYVLLETCRFRSLLNILGGSTGDLSSGIPSSHFFKSEISIKYDFFGNKLSPRMKLRVEKLHSWGKKRFFFSGFCGN